MAKRTKIICTIGPASESAQTLEAMVGAGMNAARLNMSHGSYENHAKLIRNLRAVSKKTGEPLAILMDLQGPKIRVGNLPKEGVKLEAGRKVIFTNDITSNGEAKDKDKIPVAYLALHKDIKAGSRMLLDDGLLEARVSAVKGKDIYAKVIIGGMLASHKGLNLPDASISIPAITNKDKEDIKFGLNQKVDFIALSFVREADDVRRLRRLISFKDKSETPIKIIVKIEKHEAIKNFDEILEEADGVMVARGDLAIETPAEHVPIYQKEIIDKCRHKCKPVIVATQMLDSMIRNPRPTRAEVSDVANAVIDHADAVMLSGESATGKYPVEAVKIMAKTIEETERSKYDDVSIGAEIKEETGDKAALTAMATLLDQLTGAKIILGASWSGITGQMLAHYRPEVPIVIGSPNERVVRQLNLSWGIRPFFLKRVKNVDALIDGLFSYVKKAKLAKRGDRVILLSGEAVGAPGRATLVGLRRL
ncbi:pyruvate kinase [Candidatus Uhrbacteria bacterium]|nr:pyruvate kinase [Candidatus Uhrbacteria bacterium]